MQLKYEISSFSPQKQKSWGHINHFYPQLEVYLLKYFQHSTYRKYTVLKTCLDHCQSIWDIDLYYLPSTAYLCFCLEDIEWTRVHSDFTFLCFGYLPFHISFKHHTLDDTRLVNSWPLKIKRKIYFCWCLYTNKMHISSHIKTAKSFR